MTYKPPRPPARPAPPMSYPDGPWDEHGNLRLPQWVERAGPMPPTEPVWYFWATVGKLAVEG